MLVFLYENPTRRRSATDKDNQESSESSSASGSNSGEMTVLATQTRTTDSSIYLSDFFFCQFLSSGLSRITD